MLSYDLLKNTGGITLCGDYTSLRALHEVLHEVNEASPIIKDKEGPLLGFAYDVRKAFEQERKIIEPPAQFEEIGVRYGVKIVWPVLLVVSRLLRESLGWIDSTKRQQAMTYALESVIEEALRDAFRSEAEDLLRAWRRINAGDEKIDSLFDSRGAVFCSWSGAQRRKMLHGLILSFDPLYGWIYGRRAEHGDTTLIAPAELDSWTGSEWPDPRC